MEAILKSGFSAILAYSIHYGTTKFYNLACVPDGIMGYFNGLITTGSPVCQVGLQVIANTQVSYSTLLTVSMARLIVDIMAFK